MATVLRDLLPSFLVIVGTLAAVAVLGTCVLAGFQND